MHSYPQPHCTLILEPWVDRSWKSRPQQVLHKGGAWKQNRKTADDQTNHNPTTPINRAHGSLLFPKNVQQATLQKGQGLRIQQEAPTKGPGTEDPASNRVQYTRSSNLSTQKDELLVPTFVGLDSDEDPINPFPATPMALIAGPTKTTSSSSSKSPTYSTPTAGTAASIKQLPHAAKPTHQR
jgi:hypothetical protein